MHCFTFSIPVSGWSNNRYTLADIYGLEFGENCQVIVSPAPSSVSAAYSNRIICSEYGNDSTAYMTFTCSTTPTSNVVMNVLVIGGIGTDNYDE